MIGFVAGAIETQVSFRYSSTFGSALGGGSYLLTQQSILWRENFYQRNRLRLIPKRSFYVRIWNLGRYYRRGRSRQTNGFRIIYAIVHQRMDRCCA